MSVSIVIATHGDDAWKRLALNRAIPSTQGQHACEVVVEHQPRGSLALARNRGASIARGEMLCYLDADDELAPGYIAEMQTVLNLARRTSGRTPLVLCPSVQYVHPDGTEEEPRILNTGVPLVELNCCVIGSLIPRGLFLELGGFRPDLPAYEDWFAFLQMERAGAQFIDVPGAVYRAHLREGSRNVRNPKLYWEIRAQFESGSGTFGEAA